MYLAIKYQYILYTLDSNDSISFKTFLPKKKKVFYMDIIGEYATFYKYQKITILNAFIRVKSNFKRFLCFKISEY